MCRIEGSLALPRSREVCFVFACAAMCDPGFATPPPTAQAMKATSAIKATSARGRCAFCPLVRRGVLVCGVLRCCCKVVSWTGVMGLRRAAYGVQLSWAYAPGELQGNFAEQQLLV